MDNSVHASPLWKVRTATPHSQKLSILQRLHGCAGYCWARQVSTRCLALLSYLLYLETQAPPACSPLSTQPTLSAASAGQGGLSCKYTPTTEVEQPHLAESKGEQDPVQTRVCWVLRGWCQDEQIQPNRDCQPIENKHFRHIRVHTSINNYIACLTHDKTVYTDVLRKTVHFGRTESIQRMSSRFSMAIKEG